nr:helix-turn-helix domain-containing protein [Streptomyces spiramenti]
MADIVPQNTIRFSGHDTHRHSRPHLVHVVHGAADVVVDDRTLRLRERESVWLAPRVPHAVRVAEGGLVLGPMLDPADTPGSRVRLLGPIPAVTEVMTAALGAAPAGEAQIRPFRQALGAALRAQLLEYFPLAVPHHPVARAIAEEARHTRRSLDELATSHHMSGRQVQRLFLAETGTAFARWRTRARLNAAIRELLGGVPASLVAESAGYATRASLIRALARECEIDAGELHRDPREALLGAVA